MRGRLRKLRHEVHAASFVLAPSHVRRATSAYVRDRVGRRRYRVLSVDELLATRKTDTAFVFGSGRSLVEIGEPEWEAIAGFDTISLREFPRQSWVRADYHLTSEVDKLEPYARRLRENPLYADTVFAVQGGWQAHMGNELVARGLLTPGSRIFRFRRTSRWRYRPPSPTPRRLVHGYNSIFDATNFAFAIGFRRIVLAGADYYNKEYFWLGEGERRSYEATGVAAERQWAQADWIVEMMGRWHAFMRDRGVELAVYNPRSLLAKHLPVFRLPPG
jgi:hypothetical protein